MGRYSSAVYAPAMTPDAGIATGIVTINGKTRRLFIAQPLRLHYKSTVPNASRQSLREQTFIRL